MERIFVASTNPVKINSVSKGFKKMFKGRKFKVEGMSAKSNVSDQPMSDEETYVGALNRVNNLSKIVPEADYWVGIEGGIYEHQQDLGVFAWVIIKSKNGKFGKGRTATFILPEKISKLIKKGMELGKADDEVFGRTNSAQANGTIGILTGDIIDRTEMYFDAVVFALIPFRNPNLY